MKKLIFPVILSAIIAISLTSSSCNEKVCTQCYKISDSTDTKSYCSDDALKRNDFVVEQTQDGYNCAVTEE